MLNLRVVYIQQQRHQQQQNILNVKTEEGFGGQLFFFLLLTKIKINGKLLYEDFLMGTSHTHFDLVKVRLYKNGHFNGVTAI